MLEHQDTGDLDLREVETEMCRLPEVDAVRIVGDAIGRPIEVHVLAHGEKHAKQLVRDVQSVALASFGLELDRRIVSVVQLGSNGASTAPSVGAETPERPRVESLQTNVAGPRCTIRVTIASADDEATGFAEGTSAAGARARLVASATLDALRQLDPVADAFDVDAADVVRVGSYDVAVVTLIRSDPPDEHSLCGSAILNAGVEEAATRAVLDTRERLRRLPDLTTHD